MSLINHRTIWIILQVQNIMPALKETDFKNWPQNNQIRFKKMAVTYRRNRITNHNAHLTDLHVLPFSKIRRKPKPHSTSLNKLTYNGNNPLEMQKVCEWFGHLYLVCINTNHFRFNGIYGVSKKWLVII